MKAPTLPRRPNALECRHEVWRPPNFVRSDQTLNAVVMDWLRRLFDLQAASIWIDLKSLLPHCQGAVLDVGCGAQPYRALLPDSVKYAGIDTSDALERFGYQMPDTTYFEGDVWPVESASVDTVIATETLEHVAQPRQFLKEARRVLKPDGWLLLTVPFAARWHYIPYDYWRFTPSGLQVVLKDAGFADPVVYARGNEVTVACYKGLALILMLLLGDIRPGVLQLLARVLGVMMLPVMFALAFVGQCSLRTAGGHDTLGYTVIAAANPLGHGSAAPLATGEPPP